MSTTRTDPHSPGNLVTEDYSFVGVVDLGDCDDLGQLAENKRIREQLFVVEGRRFASVHPSGQCDHCGVRIRYAAYLIHEPTGLVVTVGETCLENRFEQATEDFHRARKAAELDRAAQRIKGALAEWAADPANSDIAWMVDRDATPPTDNEFVVDVARRLRAYGSISDRQADAVRKALAREADRAQAEATAPAPVAIPAERLGKTTLEGKVLAVTYRDSQWGGSWKVLLEVPEGDGAFKVWTTAPAAAIADAGDARALRGQTVRWTGTLELGQPDDRFQVDPTFGFLRRPRVAK